MLEGFVQVYKEMIPLTETLRKKSYETNMESFRAQYGHYFEEMTSYVSSSGNPEAAAEEVAANIIGQIKEKYTKWGKIRSVTQFNLNMFSIYYIFPSILLTESPCAEELCKVLCECWQKAFRDSKITYTDYRTIRDSFKESILGITLNRNKKD